jgi:PAS domain S-box-containing protein
MTLRNRTLTLLTSIMVLSLSVMGFLYLRFLEISLRNSISSGLETIADTTSDVISRFISHSLSTVQLMSTTLRVEDIEQRNTPAIENQMKKLMEMNSEFANGMFMLDSNGILWVDYPPHPGVRGNSFAFREYYRKTVEDKRGVVSIPYRSRRTGEPVITMTAPIFGSSGDLIAVLGCSTKLLQSSALGGVHRTKIGQTGFVQVHTRSNLVILHPESDWILRSMESTDALPEKQAESIILAAKPISGTDWIVSAQQSRAEAFAPIETARKRILWGILISLMLATGIGSMAIRRITLPLTQLRNAARQLTAGIGSDIDFKFKVEADLSRELDRIPKGDEIGDLAKAFKEMYGKLEDTLAFLVGAARAWERTFDSVPDAICILDRDNRILRLNRFAASLMNVEGESVIGRSCSEFEESGRPFPFVCPDAVYGWEEKGSTREIADGSSGRVFEATGTPLMDEDGRVIGSVMVSRDITERNLSEQALRESEERFRAITTTAANAIILMDDGGRISYWNPAAEEMFGYSSAEVMGQALHRLIAPTHYQDAIERGLETFRTTGKGPFMEKTVELTAVRKDGSHFPIELAISVIDLKKKWHAMGIVRDISERKLAAAEHERMEAQLRQAQKMEAIGTLAGGVAHDFNNILAAIIGYTELALHEVEEGSKMHRQLSKVLQAGFRAKDLVNQILTFSRKREQERKHVQIGPILKETLKFLRASLPTTVDIRNQILDPLAMIHADPIQIHQVVMNLCTNAAYAMREIGGVLEVGLSRVQVDSTAAGGDPNLEPGPYVRLTVKDTGHGMTPEIMERVFDPFFTTKGKGEGTGLGLSVVYGIIKSLGGSITASSRPGEGTTFEILLPRVESEFVIETEITERIPTGHERILLVDDEETLVEMAQALLENLGYQVTGVSDSLKALELFRQNPEAYDLIITDQTMPVMTGCTFAKEVKRGREDIPIILCTGLMEAVAEDQARQAGVQEFLMKPYVVGELSRTVRKVLDSRPNGGSGQRS